MSDSESAARLAPGHRVGVDDIRALAGPATPHFALQIRKRILRLIEGLGEDDPARAEGLRQAERLLEIAARSGEARGSGRTGD